jgi:hypothetical protein
LFATKWECTRLLFLDRGPWILLPLFRAIGSWNSAEIVMMLGKIEMSSGEFFEIMGFTRGRIRDKATMIPDPP